jgi:hypothetical protein
LISKTYKVKLVSQASAIAFVILILLGFFITVHFFLSKINSTLFLGTWVIVSYFLWQRFVTGRTEWTLTNDNLKIVWTKRPLERTKDLTLECTEISNISKGLDPQYYHLKISLTSGETLSYFHDHLTTRDDFEELIVILKQRFNT